MGIFIEIGRRVWLRRLFKVDVKSPTPPGGPMLFFGKCIFFDLLFQTEVAGWICQTAVTVIYRIFFLGGGRERQKQLKT